MPVPLDPESQRPGTTRTLVTDQEGGLVRRTVLPGGLRVVTESIPTLRSVTFGVWVGVGSRDEAPTLAGVSHYLEHLLFKGTRRRDALQIAAAVDAVGGELNAFTAKEYTCYYARVLDADLPLAVDVVCDMVAASLLRGVDVESERGVVLEEIAMHDDDPGELVHDAFARAVWTDAPLGRPVLGTAESIEALRRGSIAGYYRRRYRPEAMVVAAAGNLDHRRLLRLVQRAFDTAGLPLQDGRLPVPARRGGRRPPFHGQVSLLRRPIEQANLVLGTQGVPRGDDRRFALGVLNGALGGGMSSRLFQEVREKRGLAYSVYSYTSQYADAGLFGVYAGCAPGHAEQVLDICRAELAAVAERGISADELARGKGQQRGSLVLGLEDSGSRMSRLGKSELVYGELMTVGELLHRIESVTLDDVRRVAAEVLSGPLALAVVGPYDDADFSAAVA